MTLLIQNAQVLFSTPTLHARPANLLVENGAIASVDAPADAPADRVLDGTGQLVMPGLVNCHTHAYMSLLRNYADDLPFNEWLFEKVMPVEDRITPEDAYWGNLLSCIEMVKTGTTTFLDMHMFKHQSVRAAREVGLRAVVSRGLSAESAEDPGGERRLAEAMEEMAEAAPGGDMLTFMLAPHAIYTCPTGYLERLVAFAAEQNLRFNIHLAETQYEFDTCLAQHGLTPTAYLHSLGFFARPTVAAHCVYLTDEDLDILARHQVSAATNPVSNLKLGNGFAPVRRLLAAGVNLCLGTDGPASNNTQNMFREMAIFSLVHKGAERDVLMAPAKQVLAMGTLGGAKALGLGEVTGSIEVGKRADLVLVDLRRPHMQPANDPVSALVYAANGSEVDTVLIDGQVVLEHGALTTVDEQRVYAEVERIRRRLLA